MIRIDPHRALTLSLALSLPLGSHHVVRRLHGQLRGGKEEKKVGGKVGRKGKRKEGEGKKEGTKKKGLKLE